MSEVNMHSVRCGDLQLKRAVVFNDRAEVTRELTVTLEKGLNEIRIEMICTGWCKIATASILLCFLQKVAALQPGSSKIRLFPETILLSNRGRNTALQFPIDSPLGENYLHRVYATGDASDAKFLRKVVIRDVQGIAITNVAEIAFDLTESATRMKAAYQLPGTTNYTLKDENEDILAAGPYYVYITRDPSPLDVYDAGISEDVFTAQNSIVIMSLFSLMTLSNFSLGTATNASLSVPDHYGFPNSITTLEQSSAKIDIAKINGPVVRIEASREDATISFTVDTNDRNYAAFTLGAQLIYSSGRYPVSPLPTDIDIKGGIISSWKGEADINWECLNGTTSAPSVTFIHSNGDEEHPLVHDFVFQDPVKAVSSIKVHQAKGVLDDGIVVIFHTRHSGALRMIGWMSAVVVVLTVRLRS